MRQPRLLEKKGKIWQKGKKHCFSVKIVGMSLRSGWGNVRDAGNGILLWKRRYLQPQKEKQQLQEVRQGRKMNRLFLQIFLYKRMTE